MQGYRSLVTGGAGFIGSHLTERLLKEGCKVTVLDNFSSGKLENIQHLLSNPSLTIIKEDLKKTAKLKSIVKNCEVIFHLVANPEVRIGETDPKIHFEENIVTTLNLLETLRNSQTTKTLVFTSTSTVYGEASQIPTPEEYGPLIPISTYGASKLSCEALITSYAHTFNHKALILRLANIVGPRSNHGVIPDFIKKLKTNPNSLEILGDGNQQKSYLYITDCIDAIMHATNKFVKTGKKVEIYNVGSSDQITVKKIAEIVTQEMKLENVSFQFTGGVNGGRGWKGDVKNMHLAVNKLLKTGWKPKYNSEQATRLTTQAILTC